VKAAFISSVLQLSQPGLLAVDEVVAVCGAIALREMATSADSICSQPF
jgi:hypothetical protein